MTCIWMFYLIASIVVLSCSNVLCSHSSTTATPIGNRPHNDDDGLKWKEFNEHQTNQFPTFMSKFYEFFIMQTALKKKNTKHIERERERSRDRDSALVQKKRNKKQQLFCWAYACFIISNILFYSCFDTHFDVFNEIIHSVYHTFQLDTFCFILFFFHGIVNVLKLQRILLGDEQSSDKKLNCLPVLSFLSVS